MKKKARQLARVIPAWILVVLLILSLVPVAHAEETGQDRVFEGEIELTGTCNGKFSLDSSDLYLFKLENIAPGDSWQGKIHVKNSSGARMEIAILSIVSNLKDTKLFDALDLKISTGGKEIYSGSYGKTTEPITAFYELPLWETITFDIVVTFPKECGNEYQNTKMDSTWTFEGRYYGRGSDPLDPPVDPPIKIQTGVDMSAGTSQNATWLVISVLCLLAAAVIAYQVCEAKKRINDTKKKGRE